MSAGGRERILAVDHAGVLGGAEHSLLDILDGIRPRGDALLLADGPFRKRLEERGVPVAVEPLGAVASVRKSSIAPSPGALLDVWSLARRVAARAAAYDLIYANSQKAFVVSAVAGWLAKKPVVWHLRDILGPPHFSAANSRVATWLANRGARLVIANSRATADAFVAAGGRGALTRVVHNGIDPAPFDAVSGSTVAKMREWFGASAGMPVAVHVGRFHAWKGQQVLLRALAHEPRAFAVFAGAPLFGEEAFAAELRALAESLGVAARVKFTGFTDEVPAILRAADIVVHSSVYPEPFGRVVVEGMLAGKPVVAANAGGVPEIVMNKRTGVLVTPDDPRALASAIGGLIDDPARAKRIAEQGAAHARANFTRDAMVRNVADALALAVAATPR